MRSQFDFCSDVWLVFWLSIVEIMGVLHLQRVTTIVKYSDVERVDLKALTTPTWTGPDMSKPETTLIIQSFTVSNLLAVIDSEPSTRKTKSIFD